MSHNTDIKKIMFLIAHLSDGGAEKVLSEISCNLPGDIEQVIVLYEKKIAYPHKGRCISLDLPVTSFSIINRLNKFIQRIFKFRKIVNIEKPDCVISFGEEPNFINIIISQNPVVTVHIQQSINPNKFSSYFAIKFFISTLYNRARVIAVSKGIKDDLMNKFGVKEERVRVIYNPVNIKEILTLSGEKIEKNFNEDNIPVVITSGRMTEQKGQWHLIRAFSEVRKKMKCCLAIMGQGALSEDLQKLSRELDIENDVIFLGWQKNPYKYVAKADVFVLSSLWEGFGIVLVEAMVCNIPVISTDCKSGPREILAPQSNMNNIINDIEYAEFGMLVPACNGKHFNADDPLTQEERIMSDAIIKVLSDKKLSERYSSAGLQRIHDFDANKIVEEYTNLLEGTGVSK